MRRKILLVDDDPATLKFVAAYLRSHNYDIVTATDGNEAITKAEAEAPDLVLLDIMLPGLDGYTVCQKLREWSGVPVIMVSALREVADKVRCLEIGADDYISKPFSLDELLARIKAVQLRYSDSPPGKPAVSNFVSNNLEINFMSQQVKINGKETILTSTEYALLKELATHSPEVLTYQLLLQRVWGAEYGNERDYLYVYVRRLRKILEDDPQNPSHIISVRDVGYRIV